MHRTGDNAWKLQSRLKHPRVARGFDTAKRSRLALLEKVCRVATSEPGETQKLR
jgi:hypothetical protein